MAFSYTVADRISFGNMRLIIYNLTDVSSSGTTLNTGLSTVWACKASNNTDSTDHFKEAIGAHGGQATRSQVTFTPATDLDDGIALVWGR